MKNVPQIVKDAAHDLIIMYGDTIDYLGKYEGRMLICTIFQKTVAPVIRLFIL